MDQLIAEITPALITLVGTVLAGIVSLVGIEVKAYIKTKTNNAKLVNAMERIHHTVETTVLDISHTLAEQMKSASADGKLTEGEASQLKIMAMNSIFSQLPGEIVKDASMGIVSVHHLVSAKIEGSLAKIKQGQGDLLSMDKES